MYESKESWEIACKQALKGWQEQPGTKAYKLFFDILVNAPLDSHFLLLDLFFTHKDLINTEQHNQVEALGIIPQMSTKGRGYSFSVIAPRVHDWSGSEFDEFQMTHRGSGVRDHRAEYPDLETMCYSYGWRDKVTNTNNMILVQPRASLFREKIHLYPRNLIGITLTQDLPNYLTEDELGGLREWYKREIKWRGV